MSTVTITVRTYQDIDSEALMDLVWGYGAMSYPWWVSHERIDDTWHLGVQHEGDDKVTHYKLKAHDIGKALSLVIERGKVNVGTRVPIGTDFADLDASDVDVILQTACFGEEVYA
jgi:hypothetical protein